MRAASGDPHFVRFGDFGLDLRSGELTRSGKLRRELAVSANSVAWMIGCSEG